MSRGLGDVYKRQVLAHLDTEYGGAAGWLTANGLEDDALAALRARLRS